jgi:hypothetical protein
VATGKGARVKGGAVQQEAARAREAMCGAGTIEAARGAQWYRWPARMPYIGWHES